MGVGRTTRFTGYWGSATVLTLLLSFYIFRRRAPARVVSVAQVGLGVMAPGMLLIAAAGLMENAALITPGLLVYGAGFGFYTFGGLSLMAVMSPDPHAGAYPGPVDGFRTDFQGSGHFYWWRAA